MKALVIEDEPVVVETIELCLSMRWPGTEVVSTPEGRRAGYLVETESPDFVILDLSLPDAEGMDVLKELRTFSDVPVLVVSARDDEISTVRGLEMGADDYIAKPFSHTEFLARVAAVLRRLDSRRQFGAGGVVGGHALSIDLSARRVTVQGTAVELSAIEWAFIAYAARNSGNILSHQQLAENVWGYDEVDHGAIKMCVHRLRQKLGDGRGRPRILRSHRGLGYSLTIPPAH